ncbi:uncharacterized protein ARMOST_18717 [Armillaria ostoyae]|uniref:Uncharacterized protein n=1 Tax=Armillaria ostoyae TaxID=47428 RepID=A0A284S2J2_ARMOS|nr:uncharacterized protein ARMOST_18717 [Armillaria ostoyae]
MQVTMCHTQGLIHPDTLGSIGYENGVGRHGRLPFPCVKERYDILLRIRRIRGGPYDTFDNRKAFSTHRAKYSSLKALRSTKRLSSVDPQPTYHPQFKFSKNLPMQQQACCACRPPSFQSQGITRFLSVASSTSGDDGPSLIFFIRTRHSGLRQCHLQTCQRSQCLKRIASPSKARLQVQ